MENDGDGAPTLRIHTIDLDPLIDLRTSFRLRWRLPMLGVFFFLAYAWWMSLVLKDLGSTFLLPFEPEWRRHYAEHTASTWAFLGALSLISVFALFQQGAFARLVFLAIATFIGLNVVILLPFATEELWWPDVGLHPVLVLGLFVVATLLIGRYLKFQLEGIAILSAMGAAFSTLGTPDGLPHWALFFTLLISAVLLVWRYLGRYGALLVLSFVPKHRIRALVLAHLQARKGRRASRASGVKARNNPWNPQLLRFLIWGTFMIILGFVAAFVSLAIGIGEDIRILGGGGLMDLAGVVRNAAGIEGSSEWTQIWVASVWGTMAYLCFMGFGFLWSRWRKSLIPMQQASSIDELDPNSVLLLRHSKDDEIKVVGRKLKLARLPFWAFELSYTFEELLAERLRFIGPLNSLGSRRDTAPIFDESLLKLKTWCDRRSGRLWHGLSKAVDRVLAWLPDRLPPPGAGRLYVSDSIWRDFVRNSLPAAKAVVVLIGASQDGRLESPSLGDEMSWLRTRNLLHKTIFILPPAVGRSGRWPGFVDFLLDGSTPSKPVPKAKRAFAVCFHNDEPVILTGTRHNEDTYTSALDIAGSFISMPSDERCLLFDKA